jgi:hypothetical protein
MSISRDPDKHNEVFSVEELFVRTVSLLREHNYPNIGFMTHSQEQSFLKAIRVSDIMNFSIQIPAGDYFSLSRPLSLKEEIVSLYREGRIRLTFHLPFVIAPYVVREVADPSYIQSVRLWANSFYNVLVDNDIKDACLVLHAVYPRFKLYDNSSSDKVFLFWLNELLNNLTDWFSNIFNSSLNLKISLENLVGSIKHPFNFSHITGRYGLLNQVRILSSRCNHRLGICLDLEHAFAAGEPLNGIQDAMDLYPELFDVVHFNSAPVNVEHGSRLDLHSFTTVKSGMDRVFSLENTDIKWNILRLLEWLVKYNKPSVFERRLYSIQLEDLSYLISILLGTERV